MVFSIKNRCKTCGEIYTKKYYSWCKSCQINNLQKNFTNWVSGNEKIDDFIQEMHLKINNYNDVVFEWIPYNQLGNIKVIGKNAFSTVFLAIWKDGPSYYDIDIKNWTRLSNKEVALKCLNNSQNINEFLNKV